VLKQQEESDSAQIWLIRQGKESPLEEGDASNVSRFNGLLVV
jgi:hypothetical protein